MRKLLFSLAAASALVAAAAGAPAHAMTPGAASELKAAASTTDSSMLQDVVYVCRHRYWSSRRVCWWRPGGYRWRRWHR